MRENKDQTIARLEKVIEAQKKEMTKVKKDRKRLNYAVERLERQINKLSTNMSPTEAKRIKELEGRLEKAKEAYNTALEKNRTGCKAFKEIVRRNKILRERLGDTDIDFNMKRLSYFIGGLYEDIDGFALFDTETLISRVNILNGEWISEEQSRKIKERLANNEVYKEAIKRCEPYREAIKKGETEALDFINMEMWKLIREYSDVFFNDWIDDTHSNPNIDNPFE